MRWLFVLGMLVAAFVLVACATNPSGGPNEVAPTSTPVPIKYVEVHMSDGGRVAIVTTERPNGDSESLDQTANVTERLIEKGCSLTTSTAATYNSFQRFFNYFTCPPGTTAPTVP